MGYGDFKLFAALGAWFGWTMLLPIILFASCVGAVVGIVMIVPPAQGQGHADRVRAVPRDRGLARADLRARRRRPLPRAVRAAALSAMRSGFRIGLTGGIACGKTTVANLFAALGVPIVDTDLLAREVVAPGSPLLAQIAAHFGAAVLAPDGSLDRRELRTRVFADPAERRWLEAAHTSGHPGAHRRALRRRRRALLDRRDPAARRNRRRGPLRSRAGGRLRPGVAARAPARRATAPRARRRSACSPRRRRAQQRLAVADDVIHNDGDIAALRDQVEKLHRQYVRPRSREAQSDERRHMSTEDRDAAECAVYGWRHGRAE